MLPGLPSSVLAGDALIEGTALRLIAVVPDNAARFSRARHGEFGIDEAAAVVEAVSSTPPGQAILSVVDVPGQAFGWREEALGLHRSLAAAVDAYATARRANHPLAALVVGKAISGAFLAHGLQSSWIGTLRDPGVEVHVMSAAAVARVSKVSAEEFARIASVVPATARDIETFATLGGIDELFEVSDPMAPSVEELTRIRSAIVSAVRSSAVTARAPSDRLASAAAQRSRALSRAVRAALREAW